MYSSPSIWIDPSATSPWASNPVIARVVIPALVRGDELITVTGIGFFSMCEHHLLPFFGTYSLGDIDAAALCDLLHARDKILVLVENDVRGATRSRDLGLLRAAGRADHGGAQMLAPLAEHEADAASGDVAVRVHPTLVPNTHPLASVRSSFNAVFVEGEAVGSLMFYGRGAGGFPTASAVLGDVIDAAMNLTNGTHGSLGTFSRAHIRPIDETSAQYLLSMEVADRPGVLHAVTGVFARHGVSIRAAEQEGNGPDARLVFITHVALESAMQATVRELRELDVVRNVGSLLRVIGD